LKLKYLGTAAAEGWPGMFCNCESCQKARIAGGRNIRTRSQAIIDDTLLIDFPADTYLHVLQNDFDLTRINHCIITHNHSDHLYAPDFEMRRLGFAHLQSDLPLTVYGTGPAGRDSQEIIDMYGLDKQGRVFFKEIRPFEPFLAGKYTVTPLKADHDPLCDPVFYIVDDGAKTLLYAHDTGYFPEDSWKYIERCGIRFDIVSLDCTLEIDPLRNGHMGLPACGEVKERLESIGSAGKSTVFCINHFSHNRKLIYDELVPVAGKMGFAVSYDGMIIEV
jgi:phosphoribosyl 1,2-cyclic phosphate phosphodiesterase